jgi:flagellar hook-basal body complex protein FliE
MPIAPIGSVAALGPLGPLGAAPAAAAAAPAPGFGAALQRGLEQVSGLEHHADALVTDVATGGETKIQDVMVATTQSGLAVDLLVQVRDRALEAYHEIMRLQL